MSTKNDFQEDLLSEFRREVNKYQVLEDKEQLELIKEYQNTGSIEILDKLIKHNLRLSIMVAKKFIYNRQSMDLMDLIQECNISLMLAIETYKKEKEIKFSSYATKIMTNNLITAINKKDNMIKRPVYIDILEIKRNRFIGKFFNENNRYPTSNEIKENLKISDEKYNLLQRNIKVESLNKEIDSEEENDELEKFIKVDDENYENLENSIDDIIITKAAQQILSEKEYYIVYHKQISDNPKTSKILAQEFDLIRQSIENTEKNALQKLKKQIKKEQKSVLEKYGLKEIEKEKIEPLELNKRCLFLYLKENFCEEDYFYIYTRQIKNYGLEEYKTIFENLSERQIKDQIDIFDELYNDIAIPEFIEQNFKNYKNKYGINKIFETSIEPIFISQKSTEKINKNKNK